LWTSSVCDPVAGFHDNVSGSGNTIRNVLNVMAYVLTYLLTCTMEQSPTWEANWFPASQEIPRILWDPKVHYHIHKCLPALLILKQLDPVHTPTSHFLNIFLILSSHLRLGLPSGLFRFPHQYPVYTSSCTCHMPRPSHRFDHPNSIGWGVQIIKLLIV